MTDNHMFYHNEDSFSWKLKAIQNIDKFLVSAPVGSYNDCIIAIEFIDSFQWARLKITYRRSKI